MLQELLSLVAAAGVLVFLQRQASWRRRSKGYPLPPSRRGLPLLGNLKDLTASLGREWEAYIEWGKDLGSDIVCAEGMGPSIVILNTKELAVHLLEVKSSVFSSRFSSNMIKHMGWNWTLPGYPYGKGFRHRRKLFQKYFHPGDNELHRGRSAQFLHRSLLAMLQHPSDIQAINKELVSGIMCSLAYGIDIVKQPYYLQMFEDAVLPLVIAAVPGRFMIDFFPWLKYVPEWMPGAGWQRNATIWREKQVNFLEDPYKEALNLLATSESAPTSFVSLALEQNNGADDKFHHTQVVKEVASAFYSAGSETTISVLNFFFLSLTIYPEVQKKVQRELDALLVEGGHIRLPTASDAEHLPYLKAVIKEIQRWQPVAPIGIPHLSTEDYVHDGYFIPKGSILISNIWAMQRDADLYPDPDSFKPERFLNPDGSFNKSMTDPEDVAFGFGRRACPGKHIALSTLFITASTVLLLFDICKARDENGNEITPTMDAETGITRTPKPYKCELKPRSEAARALIESLQSD